LTGSDPAPVTVPDTCDNREVSVISTPVIASPALNSMPVSVISAPFVRTDFTVHPDGRFMTRNSRVPSSPRSSKLPSAFTVLAPPITSIGAPSLSADAGTTRMLVMLPGFAPPSNVR
jgi:hypothetical protein